MKRKRLDSSSIASVGYDRESQTLEVEFTNGGVYRYLEVSEFVHAALIRSPSPGTYLNTQIKPHYRFVDG
ncbi:MAG: KTSC domain-containing protein [Nocardioidaceae bacterium]